MTIQDGENQQLTGEVNQLKEEWQKIQSSADK
jgi:hypothetical protein